MPSPLQNRDANYRHRRCLKLQIIIAITAPAHRPSRERKQRQSNGEKKTVGLSTTLGRRAGEPISPWQDLHRKKWPPAMELIKSSGGSAKKKKGKGIFEKNFPCSGWIVFAIFDQKIVWNLHFGYKTKNLDDDFSFWKKKRQLLGVYMFFEQKKLMEKREILIKQNFVFVCCSGKKNSIYNMIQCS